MFKFLFSKKMIFIMIILLVIIGSLFFLDYRYSKKLDEVKITLDKEAGENIYCVANKNNYEVDDLRFQELIDKKIKYLLLKGNYSFDNPLVILNPYNTNNLSFNIYFKTNNKFDLNYNISVDNDRYKDYSNVAKGHKVTYNTYGYNITGLVIDEDNNIKFSLKNNNKVIKEKNINIRLKSKTSEEEKVPIGISHILNIDKKENYNSLEDGLYLVNGFIGNDMSLFDNNGIIRANLFHHNSNEFKIEFMDDCIFYPYSNTKFLKMNALGRIMNKYELKGYRMHHDYAYNKHNNKITMLANTNPLENIKSTKVITLDLDTGKIELIIDFNNLLPEMKEEAKKYVKYDNKVPLDWLHMNSVAIVNENDILISSRELSTIIYVENAYKNPKIKYLISDENVFKDTKYKDLVLKKESDFYSQAGQHSLSYVPNKNNKDEYFITLFDNHVRGAITRPNFDWTSYGNLNPEKPEEKVFEMEEYEKGRKSKIYVYRVNEKTKSYNLDKSFDTLYSYRQGSVCKINNNYVVSSTSEKTFAEYDNNGNLLAKFNSDLSNINSTYKYSFKDFWFK